MSNNDNNRWDTKESTAEKKDSQDQTATEPESAVTEVSSLELFSELGYSETDCFDRKTTPPTAISDERFGFITDSSSISVLNTETVEFTEIPGYDASDVTDICFGRGDYLYTVDDGEIIPLLLSAPLGERREIPGTVVQLGHFSSQPTLVALTATGDVTLLDAHSGRVRHTIQQTREGASHLVVGDDHVFVADAETVTCHDAAGNQIFETELRHPANDIAFMGERILVAEQGSVLQWFDREGNQSAVGDQAISSLVDIGDEIVFGEQEGELLICSDGGTVKSIGECTGGGVVHTATAEFIAVLGDQTHLLTRDASPEVSVNTDSLEVGAESVELTLSNPLPVSYEFTISIETDTEKAAEFILPVDGGETITQELPLTKYDYTATPGKVRVHTLSPESEPTQTVTVTAATSTREETQTGVDQGSTDGSATTTLSNGEDEEDTAETTSSAGIEGSESPDTETNPASLHPRTDITQTPDGVDSIDSPAESGVESDETEHPDSMLDQDTTEQSEDDESRLEPPEPSDTESSDTEEPTPTQSDPEQATGEGATEHGRPDADREWNSARELGGPGRASKPDESPADENTTTPDSQTTDRESTGSDELRSADLETDPDSFTIPIVDETIQADSEGTQQEPANRAPRDDATTRLELSRVTGQRAFLTLEVENTGTQDLEVTEFDLPEDYSTRDAPEVISGGETAEVTVIGPNTPETEVTVSAVLDSRPTTEATLTLPDIELSTTAEANTLSDPAVILTVTNPGPVPIAERLQVGLMNRSTKEILRKHELTVELTPGTNRVIIPVGDHDPTDVSIRYNHGFNRTSESEAMTAEESDGGDTPASDSDAERNTSTHADGPPTASVDDLEVSHPIVAIAVHHSTIGGTGMEFDSRSTDEIQDGQRANPVIEAIEIENTSKHRSEPLKIEPADDRETSIQLGRLDAGETTRVNRAVQELESPTQLAGWRVTTSDGKEVLSKSEADIPVTDAPITARVRLQHVADGTTQLSVSIKNDTGETPVLKSISDSNNRFELETDVELGVGITNLARTFEDATQTFTSNQLFGLQLEGPDETWETELWTVGEVHADVEPAPVALTAKRRADGRIEITATRTESDVEAIHLQNEEQKTLVKAPFNQDEAMLLRSALPSKGRSYWVKLEYDDHAEWIPYFAWPTGDGTIQIERVAGDIPVSRFFSEQWPTRLATKWLNNDSEEGDEPTAE